MNWSFLRMNSISRAIILFCASIFCFGTSNGQGGICLKKAVPYKAGKFPFSACTGDFNGDGKSDIAVVNYNGDDMVILMNNGDGSFANAVSYPTGHYPYIYG
jgi:hypothetical protein